jgi:hypothetical protein
VSYESVFDLLTGEPRSPRVDWERHSLNINIGNTFSRSGDYDSANEQYDIAEQIGKDHIAGGEGNAKDGKGMVAAAKRARAFALRRADRIDEAKALLKEVVDQQIKDNLEEATKAAEDEKKAKEDAKAEKVAA